MGEQVGEFQGALVVEMPGVEVPGRVEKHRILERIGKPEKRRIRGGAAEVSRWFGVSAR